MAMKHLTPKRPLRLNAISTLRLGSPMSILAVSAGLTVYRDRTDQGRLEVSTADLFHYSGKRLEEGEISSG